MSLGVSVAALLRLCCTSLGVSVAALLRLCCTSLGVSVAALLRLCCTSLGVSASTTLLLYCSDLLRYCFSTPLLSFFFSERARVGGVALLAAAYLRIARYDTKAACNRAATELQQSCNRGCVKAILRLRATELQQSCNRGSVKAILRIRYRLSALSLQDKATNDEPLSSREMRLLSADMLYLLYLLYLLFTCCSGMLTCC